MPRHMLAMIRTEVSAVFGRTSGRVALVASLLIPVGAAVVLAWLEQKSVEAQFNGMAVGQLADLTVRGLAGYILGARNMIVLPLLLILATAASVAGERKDNTLREVLVRPIPRWSVVLAKAVAICILSAASLVISLTVGLGLGWGLFESAPIGQVCLGYLACLGTDIGLVGMAMLASSMVTSVGGVVVLMVLLKMADVAAGFILGIAGRFGVPEAVTIGAYLPGVALDAWGGWSDGFTLQPFLALGVLIVITYGLTCWRFERMDVP